MGRLREVKTEKAAAEREASEATSQLECAVCMDKPRDCVYLPCAHMATCGACDERITASGGGECPVCRAAITSTLRGVRVP